MEDMSKSRAVNVNYTALNKDTPTTTRAITKIDVYQLIWDIFGSFRGHKLTSHAYTNIARSTSFSCLLRSFSKPCLE